MSMYIGVVAIPRAIDTGEDTTEVLYDAWQEDSLDYAGQLRGVSVENGP